jgi:alpha/beta hydrolase fold
MLKEIDHDRRGFLRTAAFTAVGLGMFRSAAAQSSSAESRDVPAIKPGTNTSFGSLKQIEAGVLNVGYAETGPAGGPAVVLLHGWPYDIYSYVDVAPFLASAGYRVIVPYLRGYGTTRFLSDETARNGQQAVLAVDIIALMDALKIEKARNFRGSTRTGSSKAASVTICRRKPHRRLPRLWSTSTRKHGKSDIRQGDHCTFGD